MTGARGDDRAAAGAAIPAVRGTRATIYDVARAAAVSHQTVSRFVKGGGVRPAARERIERAVRELGYRPNLTARSLATSTSHRIGALAHEMFEVGPGGILQAASVAAREAGYLLDIVSLDPVDPRSIREAVALLGRDDLAAVLAIAPTVMARRVLLEEQLPMPLYIDNPEDDVASGLVGSPNGRGVLLALEHLVEQGHRDIVFVSGPEQWIATRNAVYAYEHGMRSAGLMPREPIAGDWSARSGRAAVADLPWREGFTAVIAASDRMALGVVSGMADRGVRVPLDVSVVGFDDIPEAAYLLPSLSTVHVDFAEQGRRAFARVLALVDPEAAAPADDPVALRLVVRDSSGPAPYRGF